MRRILVALVVSPLLAGCGPSDPLAGVRAEIEAMEPSDESVVVLSRRSDVTAAARHLFVQNCATCHNASGAGLNGPNLTDEFYLDIERPLDLYEVITYGRHAKGMPAWDRSLDEAERLALAAYAAALRGTGERGRRAEGEAIPPWESFLEE